MPGKHNSQPEPSKNSTRRPSSSGTKAVSVSASAKAKSKASAKSDGSSSKSQVKLPEKTVSSSASEDEDEDEEESGSEDDENDDENEEDEDEDDGVDEEGMKKLMKALGEDGLDDVGRMQLDVLEGEELGSGSGEDEEDEEEQDDDDDDVEEEEDEEEDAKDESAAKTTKPPKASADLENEEGGEFALEDAESIDEDAVPRQKITIDNKVALDRIRDTIKLDACLPWTETLTVTYPETIEVDVNDDLNRELAFYKQALYGATTAHALATTHNLPFTRPSDYFAEMVKSDAHMERIRQRLLDEGASLKRSEEKRREREGKKYGKQVQIEKIKERERRKKEMEERVKGLKRKHKDVLDAPHRNENDDAAFDVAVEDAISDHPRPSKRSKTDTSTSNTRTKSKLPRKVRDAKFGFGGGRRDKQNTRESTEKFDFASSKGKGNGRGQGRGKAGGSRGKSKRLGKSRRMSAKSR